MEENTRKFILKLVGNVILEKVIKNRGIGLLNSLNQKVIGIYFFTSFYYKMVPHIWDKEFFGNVYFGVQFFLMFEIELYFFIFFIFFLFHSIR